MFVFKTYIVIIFVNTKQAKTRPKKSRKGFDNKVFSESEKEVAKETKQLERIRGNGKKRSVMASNKFEEEKKR